MPSLKHTRTGVVIKCSDGTAARLSGEWRPVERKKPAPRKRASKTDE